MKNKRKYKNDLVLYRERIGFTQMHVARLLSMRDTTLLSKLEQGHKLPNLFVALRLAALYRVPVDFLYPALYKSIREVLRQRESDMSGEVKVTLNEYS